MSIRSTGPVEDPVGSVIEFGIGGILRLILTVLIVGSLAVMLFGGTEASSEALLILMALGAGAIFGTVLVTWFLLR